MNVPERSPEPEPMFGTPKKTIIKLKPNVDKVSLTDKVCPDCHQIIDMKIKYCQDCWWKKKMLIGKCIL